MNILFLDTETTSADESARLVQLAYKELSTEKVVNALFKSPKEISYGAMAIHHITNEMVVDKSSFDSSTEKKELEELLNSNILVAHNAPFDIMILKNEGLTVKWSIDTLKVAQHIIKSPKYNMQYLRYSLGLYKELENEKISAHDALGDVLVLEKLFFHLFEIIKKRFKFEDEKEVLKKMIEFTNTSVLMEIFPFGKHKGKSFRDVKASDIGYLKWLYDSAKIKKVEEQDKNLLFTLRYYLE